MELLHDPEFWVGIGSLLVVALLLWKGVPGMVGKMLDQRSAIIAAELDEARKLRAEAAKGEAAQFAKDSRIALAQQIERRGAAARDKIAQAEAAALNEIRALAADAAISGAHKLIAARLDATRASGLIDASIQDLGSKLN